MHPSTTLLQQSRICSDSNMKTLSTAKVRDTELCYNIQYCDITRLFPLRRVYSRRIAEPLANDVVYPSIILMKLCEAAKLFLRILAD